MSRRIIADAVSAGSLATRAAFIALMCAVMLGAAPHLPWSGFCNDILWGAHQASPSLETPLSSSLSWAQGVTDKLVTVIALALAAIAVTAPLDAGARILRDGYAAFREHSARQRRFRRRAERVALAAARRRDEAARLERLNRGDGNGLLAGVILGAILM